LNLRQRILTAGLVLAIGLLASCGGVINLPRPVIDTLNPSSVAAGATTFTLAVMGKGFAPSSAILFNGFPRQTIFLSENELTMLVNPSDIATAGTITITVFTPAPGGGASNSVTLTINATSSPVPQISTITPSSVLAGGSAQIKIIGTNFIFGSVATVNGSNRSTTFNSSTELALTLSPSDLVAAGQLNIAVLNPPAQGVTPPGGGISNSIVLNVVNPAPVIISVNPQNFVAGSTTTAAISVSGSGFDAASQVLINGTGRPTTFKGSSLVAQLATGDVAAAGTYTVQVVNPSPGGGSSAILHFSVVPSATGAGLPALVDVAPDGAQANNGASPPDQAGPSMDASGRFVAFASSATNLLETTTINPPPNPLTNSTSNIFLRDTCLGQSSCVPREILVNVGPAGVVANGPSFSPVVNSTGATVVAYASLATDLVSGFAFDGATPQVFLSTSCVNAFTGCTPKTSLISVSSDGSAAGSGASGQASISADGRFIAFTSTATNLVSGAATGAQEIYLRDTCSGAGTTCTQQTYLISAASDGTPADGSSAEPVVVSGKLGQFVAFTSTATNLVSGSGGAQEIYRVGLCIGITTGCTATTPQLISTPDGTAFADGASVEPAMTPDGRVVAFASTATNLVAGATTGVQQIYERDTCQGVPSGCTPGNTLVSVASDGTTPGNALSEKPSLGNTGQLVAFASLASNLVSTNVGGLENIYVRRSCVTGLSSCQTGTALVSISALGVAANGLSQNPVISGAGHVVAFYSAAGNLVNNDLNGFPDIFLGVSTF
jgi:IPT/TIG domain-containing protein/WD40 repeat protein